MRVVKSFLLVFIASAVYFTVNLRAIIDLDLSDIERAIAYETQAIVPAVILGSGPAGLNALLYFARAQIHALAFSGDEPGGQLVNSLEVTNWPGISKINGPDAIDALRKQAEFFGGTLVYDTISKVDLTTWPRTLYTEGGEVIKTFTVIIATGNRARKLLVPGEDLYWGKGAGKTGGSVEKCVLCAGAGLLEPGKKPDKDVIVVGGGDAAIEEAIQLVSYAKKITILVRSTRMRALSAMQERLNEYIEAGKITILHHREIVEIKGDGKHVNAVLVRNSATGEITEMPVHTVFLAIGHAPCSELFRDQLECDREGYILIKDGWQETSVPGVFAAGDVCNPIGQVSVALGEGTTAALGAIRFLRDRGYTDTLAHRLAKRSYLLGLTFAANA